MKARHIKKLRKKILSNGYYERRRHQAAEDVSYWKNFHTFKCNSFFVGSALCTINQRTYDKHSPRAWRKFNYYDKKIEL